MGFFDNLFGKGKSFTDRMRYVDDFRIEEYRDAKGKVRKKAIYTGAWTVFRDTGKKTLAVLIGSAALATASAVLLTTGALQTHAFSGNLVVMIPLCIALFPMLYLLFGAASLPYRRRPMRRDQYMHGITRMQRSSVAVLIFITVGVIASFVFRFLEKDWLFLKGDRRFLIFTVLSALCAAGILLLLGALDTVEQPNGTYRED